MKSTIYHLKTKEIKGTIEKIFVSKEDIEDGYGEWETTDSFGNVEWYLSKEQATLELIKALSNHYNGTTQREMAEDREYSRQEQIACGNY